MSDKNTIEELKTFQFEKDEISSFMQDNTPYLLGLQTTLLIHDYLFGAIATA